MMSTQSILAGKTYETVTGDVRVVKTVDGRDVVFTETSASRGVGMMVNATPHRLSLKRFADEARNEVKFDAP